MSELFEKSIRTLELPAVLEKLAADYEEAAEREIAQIVSIIEPTLIALLSIVVGGILLSVMLPMARMLTSLT